MSHDRTILEQQLDGTEVTFDSVFASLDANRPFDDGSGLLQDPSIVLAGTVMEIVELKLIRLVASTGGPRVVAEVVVERDDSLSGHRLVASTPWDDLTREVSPSSGTGRALAYYAEMFARH